MKTFIATLICIASGFQSYAQSAKSILKDDLLPQKNTILAKYLPMSKGGYLYSFYVMPIEEVQGKLNAFKKELSPEVAKQKSADLKLLAQKDLEYYEKQVMKNLVGLYGMDSVGMQNLEKVLTDKKGDPNFMKFMMEAQKKAFVKTLDPAERRSLMDKIYENAEVSNEELFKRSASYRAWLGDYITYLRNNNKYRQDTTLGYFGIPIVKLKVVKNEVPAGFVKDYLTYQYTQEVLKGVKSQPAKDEAYQNFMANATNADYKAEVQTIYDNIKRMNSNAPSPTFSYVSVDGKTVSLKDLRGKYVYIDVWATWCGPCKAEIPFLQKVEHDYDGKNIHFVSLSVDKMADKSKWISYVKDNKLGGIQVMADKDFTSDFIKRYNINSIPRFILIDPQGNIVSGDAKRPSDPLLRAQFDKLLN